MPIRGQYFFIIIIASVLFALAVAIFNHDPINVDGILYLEASKAFQQSGFSAAMTVYPWPFYSILVAWLHQALSMALLPTAFWLNNIFITLLIVFLLAILKACHASREVWWWGAGLLLLYPELNHLRAFIIRDAGYWALLFAGFYSLLCYWRIPRWHYALAWGVSIGVATLFRIEGVVIGALLPLSLFCQASFSWKKRILQWLQVNSVFIAIGGFLLMWMVGHPHPASGEKLGRLDDLWQYASHIKFAFLHLFSFSLWWQFLSDFARAFTVIYLLLLIYAIKYRLFPKMLPWPLIGTFIALNFLMPLFFYGYTAVLAHRYLMPLCFILCLAPPFAMSHLYHIAARTWVYRVIFFIMLMGVAIQGLSGVVHFGYSKAYITDAGEWLSHHISPQDSLYSNSREVLFYAGRSTLGWQNNVSADKIDTTLESNRWKKYHYLAVRVNHNDNKALQQVVSRLPLQPVKVFANERHDKVIVFYVPH